MTSLESSLGLPTGTFAKLHDVKDMSGSEARTIFKPAPGARGHIAEGIEDDGKPASAIG
jgi:hypothetical protein